MPEASFKMPFSPLSFGRIKGRIPAIYNRFKMDCFSCSGYLIFGTVNLHELSAQKRGYLFGIPSNVNIVK
jgi:hypothetical protein